jgi:hypothetical protein
MVGHIESGRTRDRFGWLAAARVEQSHATCCPDNDVLAIWRPNGFIAITQTREHVVADQILVPHAPVASDTKTGRPHSKSH